MLPFPKLILELGIFNRINFVPSSLFMLIGKVDLQEDSVVKPKGDLCTFSHTIIAIAY